MPSKSKGSTRSTSVSSKALPTAPTNTPHRRRMPVPRESAFSALFLERARRRWRPSPRRTTWASTSGGRAEPGAASATPSTKAPTTWAMRARPWCR